MGDFSRFCALLAAALCAPPGALGAPAGFHAGPAVLDAPPAPLGEPLAVAGADAALKGQWPADALGRLKGQLEGGGGLLLVGRTDPVGPRSLNRALGLQWAADAGRLLARALGAAPSQIACASRGEEDGNRPGVAVYPWTPPPTPPGG